MAEQPPEGGGGGGNNNGKWKGKEKVVPGYGKNRHGMPVGCYFVPKDLELFAILRCKLVRGQLPGALNNLEDLAVYRLYKIKRKEDEEPSNSAAAALSTDEPSTSSALPPPTPPRPLPDMAGPSSAMPLLPLQLPGLAGSSSAMSLPALQLPGMAGSSSAMPLPLSLPGLAGGMMSMADQANMASTSQASTPSSELLQDWYDEFEITYGAVAPPSPSTISWVAPQSSPTGWWPSTNGGPVQHDGYLGMAADPTSYVLEHLLPTAAIPPEPMMPPTSSPAPPPAVDHHRLSPPNDAAGSNYNHPELADYNGGVQAQHEHQYHPQEPQASLVDGEDGYGAMAGGDDAQLGGAELDTERIAEMVNHIMDGEFEFKFEDNTVLKYSEVFPDNDEVVAAPMMIDGGGDGDDADGGDDN
uniref:NAC domain-containing protein n=1 Tax=Oryza meridionalis TaxID=40149 RepID=A0A0E0EXE0_9ORYZ